eukprot:3836439-Prymnesium_polylepis.1
MGHFVRGWGTLWVGHFVRGWARCGSQPPERVGRRGGRVRGRGRHGGGAREYGVGRAPVGLDARLEQGVPEALRL